MDSWLESRICGTFKVRADRGEYGERRGIPQMPVAILERIVLACSRPGEMVIDPFLGTGTTLEACWRHKRRFSGCDISMAAVRSSRLRLRRLQRKTSKSESAK